MRAYITAVLVAIVIAVMPSLGQSLGDVARQQKQKQQAKDAKSAPKVITNEDLPAHSEPDESQASKDKKPGSSQNQAEDHLPRLGSPSDPTAAEHWRAVIRAQKSAIESLKNEIGKLNDSIHFVQASRFSNGVEYNQYQLKKKQEAERRQKQLEEETKKLEDMQESARKAGFGSAVYDP